MHKISLHSRNDYNPVILLVSIRTSWTPSTPIAAQCFIQFLATEHEWTSTPKQNRPLVTISDHVYVMTLHMYFSILNSNSRRTRNCEHHNQSSKLVVGPAMSIRYKSYFRRQRMSNSCYWNLTLLSCTIVVLTTKDLFETWNSTNITSKKCRLYPLFRIIKSSNFLSYLQISHFFISYFLYLIFSPLKYIIFCRHWFLSIETHCESTFRILFDNIDFLLSHNADCIESKVQWWMIEIYLIIYQARKTGWATPIITIMITFVYSICNERLVVCINMSLYCNTADSHVSGHFCPK